MKKILNGDIPWLVLCIVLFFSVCFYTGIDGDGRIYLLQAIHALRPERFAGDVAFMFGNQDSFSVFSYIYRIFILLFPIDAGTEIFCFCIQACWLFSFLFLVKRWVDLLGGKRFFIPVALFYIIFCVWALCVHSRYYWPVAPYAVARPLSIAFCTLGFALFFDSCKFRSLSVFLVATLIHPLMGGWCLPVWLFYHYKRTRLPVMILSAFFPLTMLLHYGVFDHYGADWLGAWTFADFIRDEWNVQHLIHFFVYVLILLWLARNLKGSLKSFALSLLLVTFVALYFFLSGSGFGHILLYQVQPTRIEGVLCIVCPILLCLSFCERWKESGAAALERTHTMAIALLLWAVIEPAFVRLVSLVILCAILTAFPDKELRTVHKNGFKIFVLSFFSVRYVISVLEYLSFNGLNVPFPDLPHPVMQSVDAFAVFIAAFAFAHFLFRKSWALAVFWGLYLVFPDVSAYPFAACFLMMFPRIKDRYCWMLLAVTALLSIGDVRTSWLHLFTQAQMVPVTRNFVVGMQRLFIPFLIFCCVCGVPRRRPAAIFAMLAAIYAAIIAGSNWDSRCDGQRVSERQMNDFVAAPLFPDVKDRGKVLFIVGGPQSPWARSRFLTGAYMDETAHTGEIFSRGQYLESRKRANLLQCGVADDCSVPVEQLGTFFADIQKDRGLLISRVDHLCALKEIYFLVSDLPDLPYLRRDKYLLKEENRPVYLYECKNPSVGPYRFVE